MLIHPHTAPVIVETPEGFAGYGVRMVREGPFVMTEVAHRQRDLRRGDPAEEFIEVVETVYNVVPYCLEAHEHDVRPHPFGNCRIRGVYLAKGLREPKRVLPLLRWLNA